MTLLVVQEALTAAGLMRKDGRPFAQFINGLFDLDPRPDVLKLTEGFRESPRVPSLRGKTRKALDPVSIYRDCTTAYFHLKALPRSGDARRLALRKMIPSIRFLRPSKKLSDQEIEDLADNYTATGELAINLIARLRGESPGTIARVKTRGAKHFARDLRSLWRRTGIEQVRVTE